MIDKFQPINKNKYIYCFKQRGGSGPRPRVEQTPHTPIISTSDWLKFVDGGDDSMVVESVAALTKTPVGEKTCFEVSIRGGNFFFCFNTDASLLA